MSKNAYELAAAPVNKVAARTKLARRWHDWMEMDAGTIADGEATIDDVGSELFHVMLDVASVRKQAWTEKWILQNALVLFGPALVA